MSWLQRTLVSCNIKRAAAAVFGSWSVVRSDPTICTARIGTLPNRGVVNRPARCWQINQRAQQNQLDLGFRAKKRKRQNADFGLSLPRQCKLSVAARTVISHERIW